MLNSSLRVRGGLFGICDNSLSVVAASEEPPPSPAPIGISFSNRILTGRSHLVVSRNFSSVFLIILLGFVFRFYNINYENLWLDEIYTFWVTDPDVSFSKTYLRLQTTESIPFLYYYLVKMCHKIFGYDPIVGRCFSAFFGFLSILFW